jgi:hypothetical protein
MSLGLDPPLGHTTLSCRCIFHCTPSLTPHAGCALQGGQSILFWALRPCPCETLTPHARAFSFVATPTLLISQAVIMSCHLAIWCLPHLVWGVICSFHWMVSDTEKMACHVHLLLSTENFILHWCWGEAKVRGMPVSCGGCIREHILLHS